MYDLSNRYLFQEDIKTDEKGVTDVTPITKQERDAAIREIASINEDIARDLGILNAIRKQQQRMMVNSPAFDMLTEDLRNVIKENATKYGTRTYKIFTDPNFKVDADLRKAAEKALAEAKFWEKANELYEEGPTEAMEVRRLIEIKITPRISKAWEEGLDNEKYDLRNTKVNCTKYKVKSMDLYTNVAYEGTWYFVQSCYLILAT